jgi:hypothetical protein
MALVHMQKRNDALVRELEGEGEAGATLESHAVIQALAAKLQRVKAGLNTQQYAGPAGEDKLAQVRAALDTAVRGMDSLLALRHAELQGRWVQPAAHKGEGGYGHAFAGMNYGDYQNRRREQDQQQRKTLRKLALSREQVAFRHRSYTVYT